VITARHAGAMPRFRCERLPSTAKTNCDNDAGYRLWQETSKPQPNLYGRSILRQDARNLRGNSASQESSNGSMLPQVMLRTTFKNLNNGIDWARNMHFISPGFRTGMPRFAAEACVRASFRSQLSPPSVTRTTRQRIFVPGFARIWTRNSKSHGNPVTS
jgi:hypothetical protein